VDILTNSAFRDAIDAAPDGILLVDNNGLVAYMNPEGERLFGYASGELIGQRVEVLVPEGNRTMHVIHREVYQERAERRPMGAGLELLGRRKDGTTIPVEISLSPSRAESSLTVAVVRDVTRQRRMEATLRRSEERHRLLNERAENIIFRYRPQPPGGFEYISASVTSRLGYSPEEFYVDDELISQIAHPDDRHVIAQILSPSAPVTASLRLVTREGLTRWFEFSITAVRSPEGLVTALEGIARDVTDRRIADEERLRLESEVEMQIERNRIAGDLHDDIIQSIYALGLDLHVKRDDESVSKAEGFDRAIEALNDVISSLRNYMHHLSGDGEVTVDDGPLKGRIAALLPTDGAPAWRLEIGPDLDLPPEAEREIFLLAKELVSNVQRHSEAANASLVLRRNEDRSVELQVRDDGVGFDRDSVGGDSFGLRSVVQRADDLGATLQIDSAPGKGTSVCVTVPADATPAPEQSAPPGLIAT